MISEHTLSNGRHEECQTAENRTRLGNIIYWERRKWVEGRNDDTAAVVPISNARNN